MRKKPNTQSELIPSTTLEIIGLGIGEDINKREIYRYIKEGKIHEIVKIRKYIKELTGLEPNEIPAIAERTAHCESPEAKERRGKMLKKITNKLGFLEKIDPNNRERKLMELSGRANDYISDIIQQFFPNTRAALPNNEVTICDDVTELIMMAFDQRSTGKMRFEASRKVFLMKFLAELEYVDESKVDHSRALNYMMGFFNRRIYEPIEGRRIGETYDRFLISKHEKKGFRTTNYTIRNKIEKEDENDPYKKITYLPSRKTIVTDKEGNDRTIYFSIEPRSKRLFSRFTKTARFGVKIGEKDVDRNGIRMVFEKKEDWEDSFRMFKSELEGEMEEDLRRKLNEKDLPNEQKDIIESRLISIGNSVIIFDEKNSLDGGEFNGSSKSSANGLKVHKFKMLITLADGRQHHYEFQIFLPNGYADATYQNEINWGVYNVNRFFEKSQNGLSVAELLFPPKFYPHINHKEMQKKVLKLVRTKIWNGLAN